MMDGSSGCTTPVLVVVAGPAGAGKYRFGRLVAARTAATLIHAPPGVFDEDFPGEVEYRKLVGAVEAAFRETPAAVLVAPFHTVSSRNFLMRAAAEIRCALLYVECSANPTVRCRRLKLPASDILPSDESYEPVDAEIPRSCQMMVDTTVGIDLWAGLAAARVETFLSPERQAEAISAG